MLCLRFCLLASSWIQQQKNSSLSHSLNASASSATIEWWCQKACYKKTNSLDGEVKHFSQCARGPFGRLFASFILSTSNEEYERLWGAKTIWPHRWFAAHTHTHGSLWCLVSIYNSSWAQNVMDIERSRQRRTRLCYVNDIRQATIEIGIEREKNQ